MLSNPGEEFKTVGWSLTQKNLLQLLHRGAIFFGRRRIVRDDAFRRQACAGETPHRIAGPDSVRFIGIVRDAHISLPGSPIYRFREFQRSLQAEVGPQSSTRHFG